MDERFDNLRQRLGQRFASDDPLQIIPYRGYGTADRLYLKGRVLEDEGIRPGSDRDSFWDNLLNMYRRFESDEIPGARLLARFQGQVHEVTADDEGYFELWITPAAPLPAGQLWHTVNLELVEPLRPGHRPVQATGRILVPPATAQFGVISDIDDTIVVAEVTNLLKMAKNVFLGNARTRLPFPGVAAFYQALRAGMDGRTHNPLFYVSSSPWNLYELLSDFFQLNGIDPEPILLLRDWGISESELLPTGHHEHKLAAIGRLLDLYPHLPFLLIGDSGQQDPEIYHQIVHDYPGRIAAVYIRHVDQTPERTAAVQALAADVAASDTHFCSLTIPKP
ncbi:MAG: phosphatase domain-containing protein [Chloroflexota bacterium]